MGEIIVKHFLLLTVIFLLSCSLSATPIISNTDQIPDGNFSIVENRSVAIKVTMTDNATLSSVDVMGKVFGFALPSIDLTATIRSDIANDPGNVLATLNTPSITSLTEEIHTFSLNNSLALNTGTSVWLVLGSSHTTSNVNGAFLWSTTTGNEPSGPKASVIGGPTVYQEESTDGENTWVPGFTGGKFVFAFNEGNGAIPEPNTYILLGLSSIFYTIFFREKKF